MLDLHFKVRDENGQSDYAYLEKLIESFAQAPEAQGIANTDRSCGHWVDLFLRYYFDYIGCCVAEITAAAVREVLFDLIPRKVSVEAEAGPEIVREVRAFWAFLGREYRLPQAAKIQAMLDDGAGLELEALLSDPSSFGMAKSFVMAGLKAGFDMSTQEGMNAAMVAYNASLQNRPAPPKILSRRFAHCPFNTPPRRTCARSAKRNAKRKRRTGAKGRCVERAEAAEFADVGRSRSGICVADSWAFSHGEEPCQRNTKADRRRCRKATEPSWDPIRRSNRTNKIDPTERPRPSTIQSGDSETTRPPASMRLNNRMASKGRTDKLAERT
jgi:hypothetical protein